MNQKMIAELQSVVGTDAVLTELADLLNYSYDSALDRATPSVVILPSTQVELMKVIKILAGHRQPYVARGAGTSLCGAPIPVNGIAVIGLARLNRLGTIDKPKKQVVVEPGMVNLRLQNALASEGYFFAPDPGSQKACTLGGNVALNAGGPHCLKYGVTSNHVMGLDIILPDGQPLRVNVGDPGYDLTGFFVGSEGTLGIASQLRLKILPRPDFVRTMVVSYNTIEDAIQSVTDIIAAGILPATLEVMDRTIISAVEAFIHAGYPLSAEAVLLVEVDGDKPAELDNQVDRIRELCEKNNCVEFRFAQDEDERQKLWEGRRGSYAAMARLAPNVLVEDGAVPRSVLPQALQRIKEIAEEYKVQVGLLFHAGDGNLHPQIIFDERNKKETDNVKAAGAKMLKACVDLGGTISGEHGIGIDKREAMKWLFSRETLSLFRRLKIAFDPLNLANPDKLLPLVGKKETVYDEAPSEREEMGVEADVVPMTEEEAQKTVRRWNHHRKPFGIQGSRSRYPVREKPILLMKNINRVLEFDRGNLTVTVQGGAPLASVRQAIEQEKQYLWVAGDGTVGGAIATRASVEPPLRDLILGMRVLLPTGEIVKFGAKTMKNVAGYDAAKLLIGSWGTLGVILDVTFRLFAFPAPRLNTQPIKPFIMTDLHKQIKNAFDPNSVLAPSFLRFTRSDLEKKPEMENPTLPNDYEHFERDFWNQ